MDQLEIAESLVSQQKEELNSNKQLIAKMEAELAQKVDEIKTLRCEQTANLNEAHDVAVAEMEKQRSLIQKLTLEVVFYDFHL